MLKPNIILIDESPIYGGHESMLMSFIESILPQLLKVVSVHFIVNSRNHKLILQLKKAVFNKIITHEVSLSTIPIKPLSQLLFRNDTAKIRSVFERIGPSLVLNIQGTIEIGCTTLRVCNSLDVPVLSYLPITKSSAKLGVFLGRGRDFLCKFLYYPIPKKIITISGTNASELQDIFSVPTEKITVVHNFVDNKKIPFNDKVPQFSPDKKHLALIGRISNAQKQQYSFLKEWLKYCSVSDYVVHVVGDGDDKESHHLRALCADGILKGYVEFHGWKSPEYVSKVIESCDALLLPSRFEGVPLVMIEAISLDCIVVGSAVDGMSEFLPKQLTFEQGDWPSMFKIINGLDNINERKSLLTEAKERFTVFDKTTNTQNFLQILLNELV
jgi:glycosyltransferase involved in cell wall biosynthesis